MRLLFVVSSIAIKGGGASKMLVWVANQFANNGDKVYIYTHKKMDGPLFRLNENIKLVATEKKNKNPFYPISNIRRMIKRIKPDLVISFMADSNLYCMLAKRFLDIPVVICERTDPYMEDFWMNRLSNRLTFMADAAVFQLQQAADYYTWIKEEDKIVIPNPVLDSIYHVEKPFSERKNEICNTARIVYVQKRQDVLIKAFALVLTKYPNMSLALYGDGADSDQAKELVKSLKIETKVHFRGTVKAPIQYCTDSKFFVLSSDFEGISNSLSEAMASGMMCISTDTSPGGTRLLITDGENGLITPRGDYEKLAEKICWCLEHPELCDKMGEAARLIVDRFSEKKIFSMWNDFFRKILMKYKGCNK